MKEPYIVTQDAATVTDAVWEKLKADLQEFPRRPVFSTDEHGNFFYPARPETKGGKE